MTALAELPATFAATRAGLHRLACYVIAPARKARDGHIGLRATGHGFGTPTLDDGWSIEVRGTQLRVGQRSATITTLRDGAAFLGLALTADPGVGADLPDFRPDADLAVDDAASLALGAWYAFADAALIRIDRAHTKVSAAQLWPEHFDLASVVHTSRASVNVGFSAGDGFSAEPYAYIGPHDLTAVVGDDFWNAAFGAMRTYHDLTATTDPAHAVDAFIAEGLERGGRRQ